VTRIYLIRHGVTEWNKASKVQGSTDIELSADGIRQAELLAERLVCEDIDFVYSSSMKRAVMTASIATGHKKCGIIKSEKYHEINLGPWEGMTISDIREKYSEHFRAYKEDPANFKLPGAETFSELTKRTYSAIMEIVSEHKGKNILIVSHGITIKAAIIKILGIDIKNYTKFRIDNTSISIIDFPEDAPEKPVIICLNDTNHLREV